MKNRMKGWMWITLLSVGPTLAISAQTPKGYALGDAVADFRVRNVDGRTITLADYRTQNGLIIVFTSNHCPFSKAYEDRIIALDRMFAPQGYPVLAIMPNDPIAYEDDSFDKMGIRARDRGYSYPYGLDEAQVANAFGATRTPQVYVLKRITGRFVLEYVGAVDDNPQDIAGVKRRYVEEAVRSLLAGRPVQSPITKPIGCAIKSVK